MAGGEGFTLVHLEDLEHPLPKWRLARRSLGITSFGMNVLELAPGETIPEHDEKRRDQEEVFIRTHGLGVSEAPRGDAAAHPLP